MGSFHSPTPRTGCPPCNTNQRLNCTGTFYVESKGCYSGFDPSIALCHQPRLTQGICDPSQTIDMHSPGNHSRRGNVIGHVIQSGERTGVWAGSKTGSQRRQGCPGLELPLPWKPAAVCSPLPLLKTIGARTQHWLLLVFKTFSLLFVYCCAGPSCCMGFALVPASGGHALVAAHGVSCCGPRALACTGFSSCESWA